MVSSIGKDLTIIAKVWASIPYTYNLCACLES
jgi:hypothetical protein